MQNTELETPQQIAEAPVTAWPDNSPTVSMDIELGKLGKDLNFDIEAYNRMLTDEGIGNERTDLSLVFRAPGSMTDPSDDYELHGGYTPAESLIEIAAEDSEKEVNKTLVHETAHYIQDMRGEAHNPEISKKNIERHAKLLKFAAPLGYVAAGYGVSELGRLAGPNVGGTVLQTVGGLLEVGGVVGTIFAAKKRGDTFCGLYLSYYSSHNERFAHKNVRKYRDVQPFSSSNKG